MQVLDDIPKIMSNEFINNYNWGRLLFASEIVDATFEYFQIERILHRRGCKPWDLKSMIKLIHLCAVEKIENSKDIAEKTKRDKLYKYLCNRIQPEDRTIRDYKVIYSKIKQLILSFTLILSLKLKFTDFKIVSNDGTIKLACNSPFNIIKRKDIHLLIKHYMVEELTKKELKQLRKSAKKFLFNKKFSDEEKIEILFQWHDKLDLTGQTSIPLYDVDARLMKVKDKGQKYKKWAYNIQLCVDNKSKLICGAKVVQYPTDHYQIPALMDQSLENLPIAPEIVCADNIYGTLGNLFYLKEHNISARIPTPKQSRQMLGKMSSNRFHSDYFEYNEKRNIVICPEKQELTQQSISEGKVQKGGFRKTHIVYYNKKACENCPYKTECTKGKYRTITREVHELSTEVEKIMDTPQGQEEYKNRMSSSEPPNGTLKNIFNYDRLQTRGLDRVQALLFRLVAAYNTIRIFNIANDKGIGLFELIDYVRLVGSRKDDVIIG